MILKSVHISKYKCINDSTPFTVDKDVTCLVGKNEAGKSAILEALNKLKPIRDADGSFDVVREYFKPEMLEYEQIHEDEPATAIQTSWELETEDFAELRKALGAAASTIKDVKVGKRFNNKHYVQFHFDETVLVKELVKEGSVDDQDQSNFSEAKTLDELTQHLGAEEEEKQRATLSNIVKERFGKKSARQFIEEKIWDRVPRFAFFSQYLRMPGQLAVDHFKQRAASSQLTDEDRVFLSLLDMIGMTVEAFAALDNYEELTARLEAARDKLTRELRSFWPDGQHLSMDFKFDHGLPKDPSPFNSGRIFRARIRNERYGATTGFDQRSNGFIWFFSFLVWFTQLQKNYKTDLVILLDEPGMALHGSAQRELLRFIDERLASNYQIIYTTHSPFMLDSSNLHRARPVEDVYKVPATDEDPTIDPARGTKVFEKWWAADNLTLFPLRGCLAYELTQTLFVGEHNLLVEGPADLMFIDWFKRKLASLKRPTLDKRWVVVPCGSISKIGAFLNLFGGNHLHCAVLCDWGDGGKGEVRSLGETALLASAQILTANEFAGKPEADLEDILGDRFYVDLVNKCYELKDGHVFKAPLSTDGKPAGRIVKAAEAHMRSVPPDVPEFTHPGPADYLLRQGIEANFPGQDRALDRFQSLFERFNRILADYLSHK